MTPITIIKPVGGNVTGQIIHVIPSAAERLIRDGYAIPTPK